MAAGDIYSAARLVDGELVLGCADPDPPEDCCLYRAPDQFGIEGGPFYPQSDLPDTIVVDGPGGMETIAKDGGDYSYTGSIYTVVSNGDSWRTFHGIDPVDISLCLIGPQNGEVITITDEFSNTYVLEFTIAGNTHAIEITRQDRCSWAAAQEIGDEVGFLTFSVFYDPTTYKFTILFSDGGLSDSSEKADPQSSPVGTYADVGPYSGITVS